MITDAAGRTHLLDYEMIETPEGWQMTLVRMQIAHKAQLIDPAGGDRAALQPSRVPQRSRHLSLCVL